MHHSTNLCAVLAGGVGAALTAGAAADVIISSYTTDQLYAYELKHMPDLDQQRLQGCDDELGLANDGAMWCVPTSTMNLMMYAAKHGFPGVSPGPANWQSQALYNAATLNLAVMGTNMGTDPFSGTSGDGALAGAQDWLYDTGAFTVSIDYASGNYCPNLTTLSKTAIDGAICCYAYGRYETIGGMDGVPVLQRTGGHMVSFVKSLRLGAFYQKCWCRDPADDAADCSQSPFVSREHEITSIPVYTGFTPAQFKWVSAINYDPFDLTVRFIDCVLAIKPKWGMSFQNTGGLIYATCLKPLWFGGSSGPTFETIAVGGPILDMAMHPDGYGALAVVDAATGPNQVVYIDSVANSVTPFADGIDILKIAVSPKRYVYATDGTKIYCYTVDGAQLGASSSNVPAPSSLAFDAMSDKLIVLSVAQRKISKVPAGLVGPMTQVTIPSSVPLQGTSCVAVNPVDGTFWFCSQGSNKVYGGATSANGVLLVEELSLPGLMPPTSVEFDDQGHLYVTAGGQLLEYMKPAVGAPWQQVVASPFAGTPVGSRFIVSRSRTNFVPGEMDGPGYVNLHPDELVDALAVVDCDADMNGDELVDGADLASLLAAWGTASTLADLTDDGVVDGADLAVLLSAWGACP